MKTLTLQVPDELYEVLEETKSKSGGTMEEVALQWLEARAPRLRAGFSGEQRQDGRGLAAQHFGAWDSGDPNSADNDRIDADLAREYGQSHELEA